MDAMNKAYAKLHQEGEVYDIRHAHGFILGWDAAMRYIESRQHEYYIDCLGEFHLNLYHGY